MGEEIYYVPVATGPRCTYMRGPANADTPWADPAALDTHPYVPPGRATCGADLTRMGSDMRQRGMSVNTAESSVVATAHSLPPPVGSHPTGRAYLGSEGVQA